MYREEILKQVTDRIKGKYHFDEAVARGYALQAIQSLESHGGSCNDIVSLYCVVDVVVKSWIEDNERK